MSEPDNARPEQDRPTMMRFKRRQPAVRMPADEARRQGTVVTLAFAALGERDAALAFLNGHDDTLGGRPLDIAIASEHGLDLVRARLAQDG